MDSLGISSGLYSIPALIELAAKAACIVHLIRTGRSYLWFWVILLLPFAGVLIYFFVEILPGLRAGRRSGGGVALKLPQTSARRIAKLKDELTFSNTIEKRVELAQCYTAAGRHDEAIGTLRDDPLLTWELARAHFAAGHYRETLAALAPLAAQGWRHDIPGRLLLAARAHEALGDHAAADAVYAEALKVASGQEARCRYALLLERLGRTDEARALFAETVEHARRADGRYRRMNAEWIKTARARLAALESA
ncbi:hypothetical protein OPIT5_11900 [Opitutaceae bacterium TAV5]|nr:hypothetical protein OPIT5_11900 [Opitutaceae bacterium TAV5]